MASRNLTKKFETLRAAARQRRPHYLLEEKSLLGPSDTSSNGVTTAASTTIQPVMPPEWVDIVDGIHADMKSVKDSLRSLAKLHEQRLKVSLAFNDEETAAQDQDIDILSSEVTRILRRCHNNLARIADAHGATRISPQEVATRKNVMRAIGMELKDLSRKFQHSQKAFLKQRSAQENVGREFGFADGTNDSKPMSMEEALDRGLTPEQMEQMNELVERDDNRYAEIVKIAQSINELSSLFKELNVLIIEQGSILDRIDYNIEQTVVKVQQGTKELEKADEYSKKAYTMKCIFVLIAVIVIMLIVLIWKKS